MVALGPDWVRTGPEAEVSRTSPPPPDFVRVVEIVFASPPRFVGVVEIVFPSPPEKKQTVFP